MQILLDYMGTAAVSMRSALKYRRNWNKNGPTVQLLRKFMPRNSKGFRVYIPIGVGLKAIQPNVVVPYPVRLAVRKAGFKITDYKAKKCVKISDKEQKNEFNIGKVIAKDPVAKAAFDNDPQLQNSTTAEFTLVVSCHPYDIIGMSTGRDWDQTSCMRLRDYRTGYTEGINSRFLEKDVAEGTLVAYAIRSNDTNIQNPLARCLLKPFLKSDDKDVIMYRRESNFYGNPVPGLPETLAIFLRKLNAGIPAGIYHLNENLYNDGIGGRHANESSSDSENGVDWTVVDERQTLRERPDLYPSFVQHIVKNVTHGVTDPSSVPPIISGPAQVVPARYVKQAARLLTDPKIADAFYDQIASTFSMSDSHFYSTLMTSKTFRNAMRGAAKRAELAPDTYMVLSHLNPENAHKYYTDEVSKGDVVGAAVRCATGYSTLNKKDIESNPELHTCIWYIANLIRDASVFGYENYQESAHRLLSTLDKPEKEVPEIPHVINIADTLGSDADTQLVLGTMLLNFIRTKQTNLADLTANYVSTREMARFLLSRKVRRAFFQQMKTMDRKLRSKIADGIIEVFEHADNEDNFEANSAAREISTYIEKNGFDFQTIDHLYGLVARDPDLLKYVSATDIKLDKETVYLIISNHGFAMNLNNMDRAKNPVLFRIIDTYLAVQRAKPREGDVERVADPAVLEIMSQMGSRMPEIEFDFEKFPQFFDLNHFKTERPNPVKMFERGTLQKIFQAIAPGPALQVLWQTAKEIDGYSLFLAVMGDDDRMIPESMATTRVIRLGRDLEDEEGGVQRMVERAIAAVEKIERFANIWPKAGTASDWQRWIPQVTDEHVGAANTISAKLVENVEALKKSVRIFEMFYPEVASLYPADWPKPQADK